MFGRYSQAFSVYLHDMMTVFIVIRTNVAWRILVTWLFVIIKMEALRYAFVVNICLVDSLTVYNHLSSNFTPW